MNTANKTEYVVSEFLHQYGLTLETISARANCSITEVHQALHPDRFESCPLILVAKVWSAVELELSALGWSGEKEKLWGEFNARLRELARTRLNLT